MSETTCSECGNKYSPRYMEEHHNSYDPPKTKMVCRRCHQKIHDNQVIEGELTLAMRQYNKYVQLGTAIKNTITAWKKEFQEINLPILEKVLDELEAVEKKLIKEAEYSMGEYTELQDNWRGIGSKTIAQLLAFAHPKRFPTVSKFLYYCGRKGVARENNNYNHHVSSVLYQVSENLIRANNEKYRGLYDEIKERFNEEYSEELEAEKKGIKGKIHGKTLNRVSTLWAKDFYYSAREKGGLRWG